MRACRVDDPHTPAALALAQCFDEEAGGATSLVLMSELRTGDLVLGGGLTAAAPVYFTRVVVNQHRSVLLTSALLHLHHTGGTLSLTPDHAMFADGKFIAARHVHIGSQLSSGDIVTRVTSSTGGVINPVTVSGTILAAGPTGSPILAATHPEWAAQWFLASSFPFPFSLISFASYLFPLSAQAFYDAAIEPRSALVLSLLQSAWEVAPHSLVPPAMLLADALIAIAGAVFHVASEPLTASVLIASAAVRFARK